MKSIKTYQDPRLLPFAALNLIIALTCAAGPVSAQIDPGSGSPSAAQRHPAIPQNSPASAPTTTRNRQTSANPVAPALEQKIPAAEPSPALNSSPETGANPEQLALRDAIDDAPNPEQRARLQLKLVDQLIAAGMKQEALSKLNSMSQEDRFDPPHFYNIANAMARLNATDPAIKTYRKAIEQRKGHYSRASNNLGVVLLRQGFWDEAYEALVSALRQESFRYAEASYNLGRLYAARGENDLAIREWQRAIAVDPDHTAARSALAGAGSGQNITVAANRTPSRVPISGAPSSRTRSSGSQSRAALTNPSTLSVDAETYTFLQRGRSARERGRNEEAVTNYGRVISRMGGYFSAANLELSYSLMALKRNDEAIATLLPVTQRDGARFPISYYHLARLYELRGDLPRAEEGYGRASESYRGNNTQFLLDLSRVREKRGDLTGALAALEQYIKGEEQRGQKPDWSDERLATLREKLRASRAKQ